MNRKVRKTIAAALACATMITASTGVGMTAYAAGSNTTSASDSASSYKIKRKAVTLAFLLSVESFNDTINVYFMNGSDVPYLDVDEWIKLQKLTAGLSTFSINYDLTVKKSGDKLRITRDNGTKMTVNFKTDIIEFDDFNGFLSTNITNPLDVMLIKKVDQDGNPMYLKNLDSTIYKSGRKKIMDLGYYNIDLVRKGSHYYIPLQTLSDIFMSKYGKTVIYNGHCIYVYGQLPDVFKNPDGSLSETGEAVFGKNNEYATGKISKTMAKFNYDELCFAFDNLYGLKESHQIYGFRELVKEFGFEKIFLGTDAKKIDEALCRIVAEAIDDKHTKYTLSSYASGIDYHDELIEKYGEGRARTAEFALLDEYNAIRLKRYPDGVPGYEEIGDTAFITFDIFTSAARNYYDKAPTAEDKDTIAVVSYSVQQILRKNSPIKNVVLDLSCNTGGDCEAGAYTIAAFLGTASISEADTNTGEFATNDYMCDTNFDKKFDSDDTLAGKGLNLYCLESGISFSCGNLVPAMFKDDPHVTLIGQRSSGGSCMLTYLSTAIGSVLRLSSTSRASYMRNGAFYDVDQGVEPDLYISKAANFYNRKKLVKYINGLL